MPNEKTAFHVICERDVGLFSLVQQVVANIPWALHEGRVPVAFLRDRCCYFHPDGHRDADTVWEYYFEPLLPQYPAASLPADLVAEIEKNPPTWDELGRQYDGTLVTAHFGDHPELADRALVIPYLWDDPDDELRRITAALIDRYVRPRSELLGRADAFWGEHAAGSPVIGVHVRGTDAVSYYERRAHRLGSLSWRHFRAAVDERLDLQPSARIFVASDSARSVEILRGIYGDRVFSCAALRHQSGRAAGFGPTGGLLPAYIADDSSAAARNGEEAVIDYLLLGRCDVLVHNGSGLARTVLMAKPDLSHVNAHLRRRLLVGSLRSAQRWVHRYRYWRGEREPHRVSEA